LPRFSGCLSLETVLKNALAFALVWLWFVRLATVFLKGGRFFFEVRFMDSFLSYPHIHKLAVCCVFNVPCVLCVLRARSLLSGLAKTEKLNWKTEKLNWKTEKLNWKTEKLNWKTEFKKI